MGGCDLSHDHVEDDTKSTCVKFGGWKRDRTRDMVSLNHAYTISDLHKNPVMD